MTVVRPGEERNTKPGLTPTKPGCNLSDITRFLESDKVVVATRPDKYATWGVPYTAEDMTWKG